MEKIKSFTINHDVLVPGFYISRVDSNVVTYDMRTRRPNMGDYMSNATMHSVEHMFATLIRNSRITKQVLYFGPMGCQTGFYLLVKDIRPVEVFEIVKQVLEQIVAHEGPVYGASAMECGHYENLDMELAREECRTYLEVLNAQTDMDFNYPE